MESLYESFLKRREYTEDYTSMVSQKISISDGINHLPITDLYKNMMIEVVTHDDRINGYTASSGHPLLRYGTQMYERSLAGCDIECQDFAEYVVITAGATSAIQSCMMYYASVLECPTAIVTGMNYYLFEKSCEIFKYKIKVSIDKDQCMPSCKQLCSDIANNKGSLVVLTQPSNPSGEIYEESEIREILRSVINAECILLLDVCQMDELIDTNFVNIQKLVFDEQATKQVVMINSFSKTRAIAGARIGYVLTQDQRLADFMAYYNEMLYFNHSLGFENGIIIDYLYRTLLRTDINWQKVVIRNYRNLILLTVGIEGYQKYFKKILSDPVILDKANEFKNQILHNHAIVQQNYQYCVEKFGQDRVTRLAGGYNFCLRIPREDSKSESEIAKEIENKIGSKILTQNHFIYPMQYEADYLWMRISAALDNSVFVKFVEKLE